MREIQVEVSRTGARVFRNQVGTYELADGRYIKSGLCIGSSDLVGWRTVTITPDMIGNSVAIFACIEVKTKTGRITKEQLSFIEAVRTAGGIAVVAKSVDEAVRGILEFTIRSP